jgi:predicted MFS family arabinose efflux permease
MLTSSVNVVQSAFPDSDQGEISGLSRSVSNIGSSLGTALVGSILVAVKMPAGKPFAGAIALMLVNRYLVLLPAVRLAECLRLVARRDDLHRRHQTPL